MLKVERKKSIIKMLKKNGSVNIHDLSEYFGVTTMTIRRDLEEIKSQDSILRTHGGAIYITKENKNHPPSVDRINQMQQEKIIIAKKMVEFINKNETIFLGSGTTTLYVAKELKNRDDLTIVTNSLTIVNELAINGEMNLIIVGGFLRRSEYSMIGHLANALIQDLHVDKLIIGIQGIHPKFGLTSNHPEELLTDRMLIQTSENIFIVADHTKIGHVAASRTTHLKPPLTIITTKHASPEMVNTIQKKGIEILLV